ncbi:MAG: pyridoxamine 5'-phosphate oxidase [Acidimicrobiia bacterium]|nr:pyridoxamine 5'-phosphate oxidase [Acidimicrobiia bacterium]
MTEDPLRVDYQAGGLDGADLAADPFTQFASWFDDAVRAGVAEPNTMVLATVDDSGRPAVRAVLMKSFDQSGLVFFTNYESAKGYQLLTRPVAEACFVWQALHRQVRIGGPVVKVDPAESDAYFASRPRGAQLAAWASHQSAPIASRRALVNRFEEAGSRFGDGPIERPEYWGGYRLEADRVEFWQGQPDRLHDRIEYCLSGDDWSTQRLCP